jgi:Sap, sulfolipid-1-addressing protein
VSNLLKVLPLAFVMVAGPQIISPIFLATSENWRRNSVAYVTGAALSITLVVTAAFLLSSGASDQGASNTAIDWVILALLLVAAVYVFHSRDQQEPPKWMGKLQTADPKFSFRLGFLLLGFFPSDIVTSITVGAYLSNQGDPWTHSIPFIVLTLLFLSLPALLLLALGARAKVLLPKARNWMNTNSWIVSELVIGLFIALSINNIASG